MGLTRELAELWRFHFRTAPADRAITFYSEHESYYAYFEGLIAELKVKCGTGLCYVTSDPNDPILTVADSRIHAFYIDKLLPFFMKTVTSD